MTVKEFSENELLFNKLYEKTKYCGRNQFVNLLMQAERENKDLKRQLLEENRKYEEVIDKLKNIINEMINCGYIVENGESAVYYIATGSKSEFGTRAKVLLDILKEVE